MSYSKVIQTSNDLNLVATNVKINGSNALKANDLGSSVQAYNANLSQIASVSGSSGKILKHNGSAWVAGDDNDTTYTADNSTLQLVSGSFSVKNQQLLDLAGATPSSGQVLKYNGSNWAAANDNSNSYTAGDGLGLSSGEFAVDNTVVRTSGNQTVSGVKTFASNAIMQANFVLQNASQTGYSLHQQLEATSTSSTQANLGVFTLSADEAVQVYCDVVCADDSMGVFASFMVDALVYKAGAGSATFKYNSNQIMYRDDNTLACVLDVSGNDVRVRITGLASTNLRWKGNLKVVQCPKY